MYAQCSSEKANESKWKENLMLSVPGSQCLDYTLHIHIWKEKGVFSMDENLLMMAKCMQIVVH